MPHITIIKSGTLTLLQDKGRLGYQHLGISRSGPMDFHAASWANYLLFNKSHQSVLEINLGGLQFRVEESMWLAATGAEMNIQIDGHPQPNWQRFYVKSGQIVKFNFANNGQRAYLAMQGGIKTKNILSSVATQTREKLGGLTGMGDPVKLGDILQCGNPSEALNDARPAAIAARYIPNYLKTRIIRVLFGGDFYSFDERSKRSFIDLVWSISTQSNRMGIKLNSEHPITAPNRQWSLGVIPGTIQIPPDGNPIVLTADSQTMGGYPIIGWVHPLDLNLLTQCRTGQVIQFRQVDFAVMQKELYSFCHFFNFLL